MKRLLPLALALALSAACHAGAPGPASMPFTLRADTAGAAAAAEAWWRAFAVADTAYLRRHTAPRMSLTLSSGRRLDRGAMLAQAATHTLGGQLTIRFAEVDVVHSALGTAAIASRVTESLQGPPATYRYLTLLERAGAEWRVAAAQSTRELGLTPRVGADVAGAAGDYAGAYRAPRGGVLRVAARDSALVLTDPSGAESRLEPIGPGVFELGALSGGGGVIRFVFTRDAGGRVAALSRLANGVVSTWPRVP